MQGNKLMDIFHGSICKVHRNLCMAACLLVEGAFAHGILANTGIDGLMPPQQLEPLWIMIPTNIQHLIDQDATANVAIRLDENGVVTDWIALQLPHHRLWASVERAMPGMKFSPAMLNNSPIAVDMVIQIPIGQVTCYGVLTLDPLTYLETRLAQMVPDMHQLAVTDAQSLDNPLEIVSKGKPVVPVDESGDLIKSEVVVEFFVDINGRSHMMDSDDSVHPVVRNAAHMTVQQLTFNKPSKGGKPTVTRAKMLIKY